MTVSLPLERFLQKWFGKMPPWIRAVTYLVAFFSWIYLLLGPAYINCEMVTRAPDGGEAPWQGDGFIGIEAEGRHVVLSPSKDDGLWSIPLPSRVPLVGMTIYPTWKGHKYPVLISGVAILGHRITIVVDPNPMKFKVEGWREKTAENWRFISSAYAGQLEISRTANFRKVQSVPEAVLTQVRSAIATGSPVDRSLAFYAFEKVVQFGVPTEVWHSINTPADFDQLLTNIEQPRVPIDFDRRLSDVLRSFMPESDLFVRPNIPARKQNNALAELSNRLGPINDTIIGLLDATIFGSSEECMLFGLKGVYYRTSWTRSGGPKVDFIPYQTLAVTPIAGLKSSEVAIGAHDVFVVAGSSISRVKLVNLLNNIRTIILLNGGA